MQPISLQVNGKSLVFTNDCVKYGGYELYYNNMSNIAHRGGDQPAFVFDYNGKRLALPYNPEDKDTVMKVFQQIALMNKKREEAKETPLEVPVTPAAEPLQSTEPVQQQPTSVDWGNDDVSPQKNKNMKECKSCGKEIAKSAKNCPYCGAKNKKPIYKRWWFIAIIVLVILIILFSLLGGGSAADNQAVKDAKAMSQQEFIKSCNDVDYKDLARNPDQYKDKAITVKVRVEQVVTDTVLRAYSGKDRDPELWYDNEYMLEDVRDNGEKLIEGDIVTINGVYLGTETVDRAIGGSDDVPSIAILYAELKK